LYLGPDGFKIERVHRRIITEQLTSSKILFENRRDAGRKLAGELASYVNQKTVVFGIPNGGVPLAMEIADTLQADLDIVVCRKLAMPMNPEGGLGAVADDGTSVLNEDVVLKDGIRPEQIDYEISQIKANVKQRSLKYKGEKPAPRLTGKVVIIVDDGLASGITMAVAVESLKHRRPKEIIVAVPISSTRGYDRVVKIADRVIACAIATMPRYYLADFYRNWRDISDDEVVLSLNQWRKRHSINF
jgi:putative phosphoribosyl transferase